MLLGFAIENLLKGLYVSTLTIANPPRTLRELGAADHSLSVIASDVAANLGEQFSKRELDVLAALEETVKWYGRYPSPTEADKLISANGRTLFSAPLFRYPNDHIDTCALYDRLEALLIPRAPFSIRKTMLGIKVIVGRMPRFTDRSE